MASATQYLDRASVRALRQRSDLKGSWMVLHAWGLIFGSMALFAAWPNPATFLIAVLVIGARQLGLAILMHDAAHGLLFRNQKLNDVLGQWLCALPVLADMHLYRPYHFEHHRNTQQPNDPDLHLSAKFPVTKASLKRKVLRDLTGRTFLREQTALWKAAAGEDGTFAERALRAIHRFRGPLIANGALLVLLSVLGKPHYFLMFWLLPMATWRMLVTRIRNIAEHAVVPDNDDPLKHARTTIANPLERLFIAPYYVNYHLEHHLFMWIPCYNLPRLHRLMKDRGYGDEMEIRHGYLSVLDSASSRAAEQEPAPVAG